MEMSKAWNEWRAMVCCETYIIQPRNGRVVKDRQARERERGERRERVPLPLLLVSAFFPAAGFLYLSSFRRR